MTTQYTVTQSAKTLGISVSNLKRTADDFQTVLPDYETTQGQRRTFTDADLRAISAVLTRLAERKNRTRAQVLAELSEPGSDPLIIPDSIADRTPTERPGRHETPRAIQTDVDAPQNAIAPFLQAHADTQRQIEKLSAQLAEIRQERPQERQAERRQLWIVTLSIGLLLAGVTVSAILRDSQAALWTSALALLVLIAAVVLPSLQR
jgi:DNA-binding transcriptional MerR regulator